MKNKLLTILILLSFCSSNILSQSIRKNYREMTENEKIDYVNALYQLRTGPDIINDLSVFHRNFFNLDDEGDGSQLDLHFNLPDEPEKDVFLAWHRRQMMEMEHAIQDIFPRLSIPYVDWSIDTDEDSAVWDFNFMGQFNEDWGLNRNLGGTSRLPNELDIQEIIGVSSNYLIFSNTLERGVVHAGPHNWVGGVMQGGFSPRDPIFYLHHANVDRIWQKWEVINNSSVFERLSMLRYDGTYSFDGKLLPLVNPNDLVSSNSIGVFYAENGYVKLDNYEVSNEYLENEYFFYQYQIEINNNFKIPNGNSSTVESRNQILIRPGFHAESGSTFIAQINNQEFGKNNSKYVAIQRNQIPFTKYEDEYLKVYVDETYRDELGFNPIIFPNPFDEIFFINNLKSREEYKISVFDILGNLVYNGFHNTQNRQRLEINTLHSLNSGVYFLNIKSPNYLSVKLKIFKL